jgi:hypothetical protein
MSLAEKAKMLAVAYLGVDTQPNRKSARLQPRQPPCATTSIRAYASRNGVSFSTLQRHVSRLQQHIEIGPQGRPAYLTPDEDDALIAYVVYLERSSVPASRAQVIQLAGELARRRNPTLRDPSASWYQTWMQTHPEVSRVVCKNVDKARKAFERCDPDFVVQFF